MPLASLIPEGLPELDAPTGHVLVVDDVATLRSRLRTMLEEAGHQVTEAQDGIAALQIARTTAIDIVLTDLEMPRLNGLALTRALRQQPSTALVPIVMLTSHDEHETKLSSFDIGVDEYLTKPGDPKEVISRVRSLLRLRRALTELEEKNEALNAAMADVRSGHHRAVAAERIAYAAQLAAGMAHECNNPLAMLRANLHTLGEYVDEVKEHAPAVLAAAPDLSDVIDDLGDLSEECETAAARLGDVVGMFSALQDEVVTASGQCDVNAALGSAVRETCDRIEGVRIRFEPHDEPVSIDAPEEGLSRHLAALLIFAARSSSDGGNSILQVHIDRRPGRCAIYVEAPQIPWEHDDSENPFGRWLVAREGRVTFDVTLGAAREGLLAMGALVDLKPRDGGGWRFEVTLPADS